MIKYKKNIDNIVILTFDKAGQNTNIINHEISKVLLPVLKKLEEELQKGQLKGVIITSAKKHFLEGGDLDYLYTAKPADAEMIYQKAQDLKSLYRRLERLGVPIVAAINGKASSTGFELTLACHHRIALNRPYTLIGFPETQLGFIPGGGGIGRLIWMIGMKKAFPLVAKGQLLNAMEAFKEGLVDELVENRGDLITQAVKWIETHQNIKQPWDKKKGAYSAYNVKTHATAEWIAQTSAEMVKRYKRNYPAVTAILDIMVSGISFDFDTVSKVESRHFTQLVLSPTAKNMTRTFWYDINAIKKGKTRPKGFGRFRPRQIGVIGSGAMGSAIAAVSAMVGIEVVLKDVSTAIADRGKLKAQRIIAAEVEKNKLTKAEGDKILNLITTTNSVKAFENCDLVIEAVFENVGIKSKVIKDAVNYMDEYAMFATNTSSLSISRLAKESTLPENFIGLKFFHPAEKTKLVEVIKGVNTSDETVAKAIDFVRKLRKTPIVISDRRGFFTTRIMETYAIEGIALLKDGCFPAIIEQTAIKAGMQQGPLAMMDEISIANTLKFEELKRKYIGKEYWHNDELALLDKMVNEHKRPGKKSKKGFYEYINGEKELWEELPQHFQPNPQTFSEAEITERLMFVQALEAMRCLESGVIDSVEEVNIGSVYGWGFAAHKGGVLQYVNDYGLPQFLERTNELCKKYGKRFKPPQILIDKVETSHLGISSIEKK